MQREGPAVSRVQVAASSLPPPPRPVALAVDLHHDNERYFNQGELTFPCHPFNHSSCTDHEITFLVSKFDRCSEKSYYNFLEHIPFVLLKPSMRMAVLKPSFSRMLYPTRLVNPVYCLQRASNFRRCIECQWETSMAGIAHSGYSERPGDQVFFARFPSYVLRMSIVLAHRALRLLCPGCT